MKNQARIYLESTKLSREELVAIANQMVELVTDSQFISAEPTRYVEFLVIDDMETIV